MMDHIAVKKNKKARRNQKQLQKINILKIQINSLRSVIHS